MFIVYSKDQYLHQGKFELVDGQFLPPFENPKRVEYVLEEVEKSKIGTVVPPKDFGLDPIKRIHSERYLKFLESAHKEWQKIHGDCDALPIIWPNQGLRMIEPEGIDGKLGFFSYDAGTPITPTTWQAVLSSANVALTAADYIKNGERTAFALCRPPGHHANAEHLGGYCFLNNAAIAAQYFLDQGSKKVAILDIDYHHGNGTQSIFYNRADVLFVSIHADPDHEYPHFLGFADEKGAGVGEGFNLNYPLAIYTDWNKYRETLNVALREIANYSPDVLIVSLGLDTYEKDPISKFKLQHQHFTEIGEMLSKLKLPTLFVMEGGYAVSEIGINVVNVLSGFERS